MTLTSNDPNSCEQKSEIWKVVTRKKNIFPLSKFLFQVVVHLNHDDLSCIEAHCKKSPENIEWKGYFLGCGGGLIVSGIDLEVPGLNPVVTVKTFSKAQ